MTQPRCSEQEKKKKHRHIGIYITQRGLLIARRAVSDIKVTKDYNLNEDFLLEVRQYNKD